MEEKAYLAIDLKSFYASVECMERGLDPLDTHLVVADQSRTEKTICLAVSPSLKAYGISGRARLFEVVQRVKAVNEKRRQAAKGRKLMGESCSAKELAASPNLALQYLVAPPRMAHYMEYSTRIYQIYLKYVAPEDMHVYSIDEVFMDVTPYLETYQMTARQLASVILQDVVDSTGITATAGIGTNLYLCKVAMDIVAKKIAPDRNGARIAELDEMRYRELLWTHRPLTDFWRVGSGYAKKLEANGLYTMGDIARCSIGKPYQTNNEDLLYRLFGVNAELLIDHAWGWEPCTIDAIKAYRPENFSMSNGQVLSCPYCFEKAKLVLREMLEAAALELVDQGRLTDQVVLTVGYDVENLGKPYAKGINTEEIKTDRYGRKVPKPAHGTANLKEKTASARQITEAVIALYDKIVNPSFSIRRLNISLNHLTDERDSTKIKEPQQLSLFVDYEAERARAEEEQKRLSREKQMQKAMIAIKKRYGKNAVLKGLNLQEGATGRNRNNQIGGHKA